MQNPIPKNNLFVTPRSLDDVLTFVYRIPQKYRGEAICAVQMALNWAHDAVELQELHKELGLTE